MAIPTKIGALCSSTATCDPRSVPEETFRYIDISAIDKDKKEVVSTTEMLGTEAPSRARKEVRSGDILVSTVRPNLNAVALVPPELDGEVASTGFCILRPRKEVLEQRYLFYWTQTQNFIASLMSRTTGAHYPAVSDEVVKNSEIPHCTPSEQRRIVEIMDQAEALKKKRSDADSKARRILPALFRQMFSGPRVSTDRWEPCTLSRHVLNDKYGTSTKCTESPGGLPILRIPNVVGGEIDIEGLKYAELPEREADSLRLQEGDILFVRTNGNRDYVGRCAVFDLPGEYGFASYLIRVRLDKEELDPWYVFGYLQTPAGKQTLSHFIRTTAGQSNLGLEGIRQIPIVKPPIQLQREFKQRLLALREVTRKNETARDSMHRLYDSLLHRAFTGDLTAKWREAHMKELVQEMEVQAKILGRGVGIK